MARLEWLTARPLAHRGLHDEARGVIENTSSAIAAATAAGYGIEVDLRITLDGDAVVHHDDALGRLTEGTGRLDAMTVPDLKRVAFKATTDRIVTLGELVDLVAGHAALLLELKSHYDGDRRLPARVAAVLSRYRGPVAAMSFDPCQVRVLKECAPTLARGLVAERRRRKPHIGGFPKRQQQAFAYLRDLVRAGPQFIAYSVKDLPAPAPLCARYLGLPLLAWTVRTAEERWRAERFADQMIFEGFRP
jgi:glycerophosphoryl diester phosphodiesterase